MLISSQLVDSLNSGRSLQKPYIKEELISLGWSEEDVESISSKLDEALRVDITESQIDSIIDPIKSELKDEATKIIMSYKMQKQSNDSAVLHDSHNVFNAKRSITLPEPKFTEPKFTSPVNIQDANYTTKEDYPETYGFIDSIKNWIKINKARRHAELVLSSGTMIKSDKNGNVTMHIKGSLKHIVEGDYSLQVNGSNDLIIGGSRYVKVSGNVEELTNGTKNDHSVGINRLSSSTKVGLYGDVVSMSNTNSSNELTLDQSGVVTINGTTVYIN